MNRSWVGAWERHLGHPVDPDELRSTLAEGTLPEAFHAVAAATPDRPAVTIDEDRLTHGRLDELAAATAHDLAGRGVTVGDIVLIVLPTSVGLVVGYLACLRLGAPVVFANPAAPPAELESLVARIRPRAAIVGEDVGRHLPGGVPLTFTPGDLGAGHGRRGPQPPPGPPAVIAFTSGTTGRPKLVPLAHANLLASARAAAAAWRWRPDDVLVHALPLFHQHGLTGLHLTLLTGSTATLLPRFEPHALVAAIEQERATVLFAVPTVWERLWASGALARADLSSLRLPVSGSAPLPPSLARRVADIIGQLPLERYGLSESGLDVSNLYDGPRRPGSVGLPLPGVELAIVDTEGREVPDGVDGEVVLRGPQVFAGYSDDADANRTAFLRSGWFRTGDIGRVDPSDGLLTLTGRAKEVIITGGLNVYPREVELALEQEPGVARAAVVGVPSNRWGEEVVALVVTVPGAHLDNEALRTAARARLSAYKCPKRFVFVAEIPLNQMGKIRRDEAARLAAAG